MSKASSNHSLYSLPSLLFEFSNFQDYFEALGRNGSKPRALPGEAGAAPVAGQGFGCTSQPSLGILGIAQGPSCVPGNVPRSQAAAQMLLSIDPVTGIMDKSLPAIPNPHLITWPGASPAWRQKTLRAFGNSYRELLQQKGFVFLGMFRI